MKDLERIIEDVNASMAMEGMPLTEEDKARMRYCAGDKKRTNQVVADLMRKHSVKVKDVHEKNYEYDYEWDSRYCYPNSFVVFKAAL